MLKRKRLQLIKKTLSKKFESRGYPNKILKNQINKQKNLPSSINNSQDPKFITKYHPGLQKLNGIINTAYKILEDSPITKDFFSKKPRVVFRRPPNIKDILSKPKLPITNVNKKENINKKSHPCGKKRCKTCPLMSTSNSFKSNCTNKEYQIKKAINCNSENVVYKLSCNLCPIDYIGETSTPLRIRMNNHRADVTNKNSIRPVSKHALSHNKTLEECYNLTGLKLIEKFENKNYEKMLLRQNELAHIHVLKTTSPYGLNLKD